MYRSAFIFVLFALSASATTLIHESPFNAVQKRCANEHGVTSDWIAKKSHNLTESDMNDQTTKCVLACMWRGRGMLNEDGTLNAPLVNKNFPTDIPNREGVAQAFTDCSKEKGDNVCETVAKTVLCLYGNEAFRSMHPAGTPFAAVH